MRDASRPREREGRADELAPVGIVVGPDLRVQRHVLGLYKLAGGVFWFFLIVSGFGVPSEEEQSHDYLWRIHAHAPRRGVIAVFDRSDDVLEMLPVLLAAPLSLAGDAAPQLWLVVVRAAIEVVDVDARDRLCAPGLANGVDRVVVGWRHAAEDDDRDALRRAQVSVRTESSPTLLGHGMTTGQIPLAIESPRTPTWMEPGVNCDRRLLDSDKSGLDQLAASLAKAGVELVSTGGTAAALREDTGVDASIS